MQNDCIGPYLVIAPLSTLPHWQREIEAWTELNCILYHGDQESRRVISEYVTHYRNERGGKIKSPHKFHILLTSPEMGMLCHTSGWGRAFCDYYLLSICLFIYIYHCFNFIFLVLFVDFSFLF